MIKEKEEIYKTKFSSLKSHTFFGNEMYFKLSQTLRQFQIKVSAAAVIHTPILIAIFFLPQVRLKFDRILYCLKNFQIPITALTKTFRSTDSISYYFSTITKNSSFNDNLQII